MYLVILNLVVHGVIPLLLLTFLNILVYRQVRGIIQPVLLHTIVHICMTTFQHIHQHKMLWGPPVVVVFCTPICLQSWNYLVLIGPALSIPTIWISKRPLMQIGNLPTSRLPHACKDFVSIRLTVLYWDGLQKKHQIWVNKIPTILLNGSQS